MKRATPDPTPKQPAPEHRRDWYPYYAGFTEDFVTGVLKSHLGRASSVVDPWNGSGTTTVVCARQGLRSAGLDIIPSLTVIARARLTPDSVKDSLVPIGREILDSARRQRQDVDAEDPLKVWLRSSAVERIRAIQAAIHSVLSEVPNRSGLPIHSLVEGLPLLACLYYTALFAVTKDVLSRFRATNPTWIRFPESSRNRLGPNWGDLEDRFLSRVEYLKARLTVPDSPGRRPRCSVRTGSATSQSFKTESFAAAITSPPYATRIDYVRAVLPELAVLGANLEDLEMLRRSATGSPVVRGVEDTEDDLLSPYAHSILKRIGRHPSKGSRAYYLPWMSNYLHSLQSGLRETTRVVKRGGPICIIVQDSYYKEIHMDLQRIITEIMLASDRKLMTRADYQVRNHRARSNPRASRYVKNREAYESLLVFE
jgi:DNA modification methylase